MITTNSIDALRALDALDASFALGLLTARQFKDHTRVAYEAIAAEVRCGNCGVAFPVETLANVRQLRHPRPAITR